MAEADRKVAKPSRRRMRAPSPDTPDPVEMAMKAVAAGAVPSNVAQTVLEKHAGLIEIQCKREREELANVRVQRITRWLFVVGLFALLLSVAGLLLSAYRSTALVVEPFRVPQEMAQRGLDGPAVAAQLLDRLSDLQEQTQSARIASSYANDWGDNLAVAIPETGISLSEAWRFLRRTLGNETRITGEVWRGSDGTVTVTARAGSSPARTFSGPEAELNRLIMQAAESVYRITQPYRFFVHANNERRFPEAEAALRPLLSAEETEERKWAYVAAANLERQRGNLAASSRYARMALDLDPEISTGATNLSINAALVGHSEQELARLNHAIELQTINMRDGRYDRSILEGAIATTRSGRDALMGDFQRAVRLEEAAGGMNRTRMRVAYRDVALWYLRLHDLGSAERAVDTLATVVQSDDLEYSAALADRRLRIAIAQGDAAMIRSRLTEVVGNTDRWATHPDPYRHRLGRLWKVRSGWTAEALGLSALGEHEAAIAVVERTPGDCYDCLRARGEVLAAAGRRVEAERAFAEAARQAPSLSFAHTSWGQARLLAGDLRGATQLLEEAHRRAPRFADPLKYLGDALMRSGRAEQAESRYAMAADRAPRWGALYIDWGIALWRLGRRDEARTRFAAAGYMSLSNGDRARLARIATVINEAG